MGKLNPEARAERDKRIVELRTDGLLQREIAAEVGCSVGTVSMVLDPAKRDRARKIGRETQRRRYYKDPEAARARSRAWWAENVEYARESSRSWTQANVERRREYRRQNRDRIVERKRAWRQANPEKMKAASERWRDTRRAYYEANKEQILENCRQWKRNNPVNVRSSINRRRGNASLGMDAFDKQLSVAYRKAIKNDPCVYCGAPGEHDDHITPVFRDGTDHWWNLQRTCKACNHRKFKMTHEEFVASGRAPLAKAS